MLDYFWNTLLPEITNGVSLGAVLGIILAIVGKRFMETGVPHIFNAALENLQSKNRKTEFKELSQFSEVYKKQAETIASFYGSLAKLMLQHDELVDLKEHPLEMEQAQKNISKKRINEFLEGATSLRKQFSEIRLYFSSSTCEKVDELMDIIRKYQTYYFLEIPREKLAVKQKYSSDEVEEIRLQYEKYNKKLPEVIKSVEDDFREILGYIHRD